MIKLNPIKCKCIPKQHSDPQGPLPLATGTCETRPILPETVGQRERSQPQAEATTLLHESPNSKPETIEQRKIVFHYIRVGIAWMGVVPLVGAEPKKGGRETERQVSVEPRIHEIKQEIKQHWIEEEEEENEHEQREC